MIQIVENDEHGQDDEDDEDDEDDLHFCFVYLYNMSTCSHSVQIENDMNLFVEMDEREE